MISLTGAMLAATWGGQKWAWTSAPMLGLLAATAVATAVFVRVERTAAEPVMPIDLFKRRSVTVATVARIPHRHRDDRRDHLRARRSCSSDSGSAPPSPGLLLLPLMLSVTVATTIGGKRLSRTARYRSTAIVGALVLAAGTGLLATMTSTTALYVPSIAVGLVGVGIGLTTPTHMVAVQNAVDDDRLGAATSLTQFTRKIGSTVGVAVAGGLFTAAHGVEAAIEWSARRGRVAELDAREPRSHRRPSRRGRGDRAQRHRQAAPSPCS